MRGSTKLAAGRSLGRFQGAFLEEPIWHKCIPNWKTVKASLQWPPRGWVTSKKSRQQGARKGCSVKPDFTVRVCSRLEDWSLDCRSLGSVYADERSTTVRRVNHRTTGDRTGFYTGRHEGGLPQSIILPRPAVSIVEPGFLERVVTPVNGSALSGGN